MKAAFGGDFLTSETMYQLQIETDFSAAHRLRQYKGSCERLHGHNYRVQVILGADSLHESGMLLDFREAKHMINQVVGQLDHQFLNELKPFDDINPTSEHIARHIAEEIEEDLPEGTRVDRVTCWESDRCAARYSPDTEG